MTPVDLMSSIYIDFNKENNKKDPKFKVGDHVKMSKYIKNSCKRIRSKLVQRNFYN